MIKILVGLILAFLIGAGCRYFGLPVPAPPALMGVALIFMISLGFIVTDKLMTGDAAPEEKVSRVETQR